MKTCGNCVFFKNGCNFSASKLPSNTLKNYVACADYIDKRELSQVERKTGIGQ